MSTSHEDFSKLTVPKELRSSCYSKLGKAVILEKLALHEGLPNHPAGTLRTSAAERVTILNDGNPSDSTTVPHCARPTPSVPPEAMDLSKTKPLPLSNKRAGDFLSLQPATHKKQRPPENVSISKNSSKKPPNAKGTGYTAKKPALIPLESGSRMKARNLRGLSEQNLPGSAFQKSNPNLLSATDPDIGNNSSKRFGPLLPLRKNLQTQAEKTDFIRHPYMQTMTYLDFSFFPPPLTGLFLPITIPPSLSQIKRINAWSVILSRLSDMERRRCALVSRSIRYAVYLSAIPIINRVFGTRRLAQLPEKYNMSMTNFWPLYKQLQSVTEGWRSAYMKSFLIKFFGSRIPIADAIWGCPEHDKQLTVTLRFLMTRVWFAITVNSRDTERTGNSIVIDAQETVKDEIWRIKVLTRATFKAKAVVEMFYVLEATCEVIGLAQLKRQLPGLEASNYLALSSDRSRCLRVDWSEYVRQRVSDVGPAVRLLDGLRTTNAEEYAGGISSLWLTRISKEGQIGEYKKAVAERYILACVVQNSVSGQWMSTAHMEQVFAGTTSESDLAQSQLHRKERRRMDLFLPAHHLVESLHFTTSGKNVQYLHPALAIVQTPGREYFILRDNGMEVGCEEDGVYPVWMNLLDCDARGVQKVFHPPCNRHISAAYALLPTKLITHANAALVWHPESGAIDPADEAPVYLASFDITGASRPDLDQGVSDTVHNFTVNQLN